MPVRFQVDPDFYDHPKVLGMSDAAFALWVRAGSYSVAKLQDGFVPEDALSLFSPTQQEAAEELVRRGLWKRTRGGFRYHEWDHRNLTKARVEADREYERERKQRQREKARENGTPQGSGHNVPPGRTPGHEAGHDRDSQRSPDRSVSVSESVSMSKPPNPQGGKSGSRRSYDYDSDPDFGRFWDVYPSKKSKGQAFKAWKAARERGIAADVIIAAAERYRDNPKRKPDYTAHPATWLNGERYNDFDEVTSPQSWSNDTWWDN